MTYEEVAAALRGATATLTAPRDDPVAKELPRNRDVCGAADTGVGLQSGVNPRKDGA